MTTHDMLKQQNSDQADSLDSEEPQEMTMEQRIEHWKRIGEANAKKYGIRTNSSTKIENFC